MTFATYDPRPDLDLVLERTVDVPPRLVWTAWTTPEHLVKWFAPRPYETVDCEIDLQPGGIFRTVMRSPEGEHIDGGAGCYLEVVPEERLVWTSALAPGFRPVPAGEGFAFTAAILLEPAGSGTRYTAIAIHGDTETAQTHADMGFAEGWGAALDQLVEVARAMEAAAS